MNAHFPRRATHIRIHSLLRSILFVLGSRGIISHAYTPISPSAAPISPLASPSEVVSSSAIEGTLRQHNAPSSNISPRTSNDVRNPMGRRAFFGRSTAAATSAAAMTLASTTRPRPANAASPVPALGSPAPEFSLPNTRGQTVTLDTLTADGGKWTVLYFYPGAFTSGCTIEARRFQEDLESFRERNAQVVGVSVDSVAKNSEFCSSEGLDYFMLTDEGGKVSKAYGTSLSIPGFGTFSNRQTYIIDPNKNVRWVFVDVESHIPKHSAEVLDKLRQLQQA